VALDCVDGLGMRTVLRDAPLSRHAIQGHAQLAAAGIVHPCGALAWAVAMPLVSRPLALAIRTRVLDGDADQCAPVGCHRPAIVVPIGMFAGQAAIIVDERFHCLR
jgi:hypothetical protein